VRDQLNLLTIVDLISTVALILWASYEIWHHQRDSHGKDHHQ
jgi:hypothetical protein